MEESVFYCDIYGRGLEESWFGQAERNADSRGWRYALRKVGAFG